MRRTGKAATTETIQSLSPSIHGGAALRCPDTSVDWQGHTLQHLTTTHVGRHEMQRGGSNGVTHCTASIGTGHQRSAPCDVLPLLPSFPSFLSLRYWRTPSMSCSLYRVNSSPPSLTALPPYSGSTTLSPSFTEGAMSFPSLSLAPAPTLTTTPSCNFD